MNYKGKLYGKVGNKYFDTGYTSDDIPDPEPLDPYTCELMVGDEVEYKGAKCVIFQIKNVYYLVHKLTGTNMSTQYRCEIILLARNGATIINTKN